MPSIPLPFVAALLMAILLVRVRRSGPWDGKSGLLVLVGACATQAVIVGLRWNYGDPWARFMQPVTASMLPGLAWLAFAPLLGRRGLRPWGHWLHVLPVAAVALLAITERSAIDPVLTAIDIAYGGP